MGGNFIFRASGARSPFGMPYSSGSHCGNRAYWAGTGGGYRSNVNIDIRNYGSGGCYPGGGIWGGHGGYYGGGCYGAPQISEKGAWWALGIGATAGLLMSPIGGAICKGIGKAFSWVGRGIGKAASWTWNKAIKPAAQWTYNKVLKPVGQGIGNFFKGCWNWITGKGWNGDK